MSVAMRRSAMQGRAYATAAKVSGAGAPGTGTKAAFASTADIDWGGILGPIATGVGAGIRDRIAGGRAAPPPSSQPGTWTPPVNLAPPSSGPCPPGYTKVGNTCVNPAAALPGGTPLTVQAGGAAVMGGFGLPAMQPMVEERIVRSCGPGMVLGKDNLCYPKGVLSSRSQFRKWKKAPKPPITASDMKAIRKASRAKDRVKGLAKDVGFTCRTRGR